MDNPYEQNRPQNIKRIDNITRVQEGCYFHPASGKPYYFVELYLEPYTMDYVKVYEVQDGTGTDKIPAQKRKKKVKLPSYKFPGNSELAKLANRSMPEKKKFKMEPYPAIFVSLVTNGISTFSGTEGLGFLEKDEVRELRNKKNELVKVEGDITGVFIALEDVKFHRTRFQKGAIQQALKEQKNSTWFNLNGE